MITSQDRGQSQYPNACASSAREHFSVTRGFGFHVGHFRILNSLVIKDTARVNGALNHLSMDEGSCHKRGQTTAVAELRPC
jgi:hypothetical protein